MIEQMALDLQFQPLMPAEKAVWDCIRNHRGKGREILGQEIAELTDLNYATVRAIIAHLINHKHKLIGSNSKGYYVPVDPAEIDEVTRSLRHRGIMILVRAARLQKTSLTEIFKQSCLELTPAILSASSERYGFERFIFEDLGLGVGEGLKQVMKKD